MTFRTGLVASSALFCVVCIAWAGFRANTTSFSATNASSAVKTGIGCDHSIHDFGSKRIGQSITHVFVLRNHTDHDLEITNVRPGCSCTKADFQKNTIKAGSSIPLKLTVSLEDKRGPVEQHITVEWSDPQPQFLLLRLKGVVESEFNVTPKAINFGKVMRGEVLTGSTVIEATGSGAFKLLRISCDAPLCHVDQETIEEGRSYRVSILTTASLKAGLWKTSIRVQTDNRTEPQITVPVVANIQAGQSPTSEN